MRLKPQEEADLLFYKVSMLEKEIERLQAAAAANICCPDCGFTGPAKDWEMSVKEVDDD